MVPGGMVHHESNIGVGVGQAGGPVSVGLFMLLTQTGTNWITRALWDSQRL